MGCGCKNKTQGTQAPPPQAPSSPNANTSNTQQVKNANIQENIRKVVEKYYKKK